MAPQSIDATIFASQHPNIAKRMSVSGLVLSSFLILVGLVALMLSNRMEEQASSMTMVLLLSGTILVIWGIFRLMWKGKDIVYTPTGSITKEKSLFFDLKHLGELKDFINTGQFPTTTEVKSEADGNIRLDVILSEDKNFAAVQLFQFVPYAYNPVTQVRYYTNGEAAALSAFLLTSTSKKK